MGYIFKTTKGFRFHLFLLFFTVISSTVTGALFPYAIGKIVDQIFYVQEIRGFLVWFFVYAGLYFLNQCLHGGLNYFWARLEVTYLVEIRKSSFDHLLRLKASVLTKLQSGDIMRRIMEDTECFLEFIHRSLFYVLANLVQLLISIGYLLYTNLAIGIISIVITPVMAYSIRYFSARLKNKYQEIREQKGTVDAWILEMMAGITEWKLLNASEKVRQDYRNQTRRVIREEKNAGYIAIASDSVNQALTLLGQLCIFCLAATGIGKGSMTVGQFVACAAYFSTCAAYYNSLGQKITDISRNLVGIKRVEDFMSWEEEQDVEGAKELNIAEGSICFSDVSFGYEDAKVLKKINLEIAPGDQVVFVGKSGEGKSTLLYLLYRLYEPDGGTITIDHKPLTAYTLSSLRRQVAVVQQENGLFHGSLRENIILSDDRSQDERIFQILEGLCLAEIVRALPDGLDTIVGNGEREFSGGQRQRLAIARAVYRKPKVLLLDEATSALDVNTEAMVNAYIYQELADTTIISVAHRFSAVLAGRKAIVMEQGQISAIGTHEELLWTNALYRALYTEYENSLRKNTGGAGNE